MPKFGITKTWAMPKYGRKMLFGLQPCQLTGNAKTRMKKCCLDFSLANSCQSCQHDMWDPRAIDFFFLMKHTQVRSYFVDFIVRTIMVQTNHNLDILFSGYRNLKCINLSVLESMKHELLPCSFGLHRLLARSQSFVRMPKFGK